MMFMSCELESGFSEITEKRVRIKGECIDYAQGKYCLHISDISVRRLLSAGYRAVRIQLSGLNQSEYKMKVQIDGRNGGYESVSSGESGVIESCVVILRPRALNLSINIYFTNSTFVFGNEDLTLTIDSPVFPQKIVFCPSKSDVDKGNVLPWVNKDFRSLGDIGSFLNERYANRAVSNSGTKKVFISVDTEDTYFDSGVLLDGAAEGYLTTREIASELEKRGMRGIFFVNVFEHLEGEKDLLIRELIGDLSRAGHEIGLHSHPSAKLTFYRKQLNELSYEEQLKVIKYGTEYIESIIGEKPKSFRAGGYLFNKDTLKALKELDYVIDSSYLYGFVPDSLRGSYVTHPYWTSGVIEFPITPVALVRERGGITNSKLDINWLRANELIRACKSGSSPYLNFMMHSFSFLKKARIAPGKKSLANVENEVVARSEKNIRGSFVEIYGQDKELFEEFKVFLDYLEQSEEFDVCTYRESFELLPCMEDSAPIVYRNFK
ncbi:polysaccharide deacetylase family protein [Microbulbifer magnicolonia]|uniref:polysaccharide deacetylase family protein n=1 Tax=Microbulbifer magnicolonia TaxID=3109744 RepID=UPI002B40427F|nr:polysaccharide deacetylase family protein [Microbulbifer sp. GG15]